MSASQRDNSFGVRAGYHGALGCDQLTKRFADDGVILVAWALAVAYAGVAYKWILVNGFGYHVWDLRPLTLEQNVLSLKLNMAQQLLYNPILCLVKASIIIFLFRLEDRRKLIRWSLFVLFGFNLGHMCGVFFGALTQCLPIHMYWDHFYTDVTLANGTIVNPNYHCFDEETFSLVTAGFAILTDVLILCVPVSGVAREFIDKDLADRIASQIAMIWNLRLNLRKKIGVAVILSLGWIVTAVSILRFKIFYDYWQGTSKDPTYGLSQAISGIEVNVAIFTACGPAMKAFVTHFAPKFFGTSIGTRASGDGYYRTGGYNLSDRMPTDKSQRTQHGVVEVAGERDSQEEIMMNDSLGAGKSGGIEIERQVQQSYAPAAGGLSRSLSGWNASSRTTVVGSLR